MAAERCDIHREGKEKKAGGIGAARQEEPGR